MKKFIGLFLLLVIVLAGCTQGGDTDLEAQMRTVLPEFHKNFSSGEFDANRDYVTDDVVFYKNGQTYEGEDAFIESLSGSFAAFDNAVINDEEILVDGNQAVVKYNVTANLAEDITFQDGTTVKAEGQEVTYDSVEFFEYNEDGQVTSITQVNASGLYNSIEYQLTQA